MDFAISFLLAEKVDELKRSIEKFNERGEATPDYLANAKPFLNAYEGMTLFLIYFSRFASLNFFREIYVLFANFARSVNKDGYRLEKDLGVVRDKNSSSPEHKEYCEQMDSEYILDMVLNYLVNYYPKEVKEKYFKIIKFGFYPNLFGNQEINLIRLSYFLLIFSRFMRKYDLTKGVLEFKDIKPLQTPHLRTHAEVHNFV